MIGSAVFYFFVAAISGSLAGLAEKVNARESKFVRLLSILIPSFFAGIRYGIGTDYYVTYQPYFDYLAGNGGLELYRRSRLELGFTLLNKAVIFLGGNFQWVLFFSSLISLVFLSMAIAQYRNKLNVGLATFVYMLLYYLPSFNIVRQMIAASIVLYAYRFIVDKDIKKFAIWIIVAALFHKTAILTIFFYFFINYITTIKEKIIAIGIYVVITYCVFNFDQFVGLAYLLDSSGYYASYFRRVGEFGVTIGLLIRTVPYAVALLLMRNCLKNDKTLYVYVNAFILGSIIRLIVYMTQFDADRIAIYFLMPQVIFIPYLAKSYKKSWRNFFGTMVLIGVVVALWYFDYIYMGRNGTIPYKTIFNI